MPATIVHLVRHGESTDNLKSLWAGWKDAPLSNHGMQQARRLGVSLASKPIARIYCSDLKRAHWTALQIHEHNNGGGDAAAPSTPSKSRPAPSSPEALAGPASIETTEGDHSSGDAGEAAAPPTVKQSSALAPPITTQLLREQHFGAAEGKSWSTGEHAHADWGDYRYRFDGGESLDDVSDRADQVVRRIIFPWAAYAARQQEDVIIVLVAHGIMISQLSQALIRHSTASASTGQHFGGLMNTSYHTFAIRLEPFDGDDAPHLPRDDLPAPYHDVNARYSLKIERIAEAGHLNGLKRQKGIGSTAHDPAQKKLSDFFAGGGQSPSPRRAARA